jgi:hypothetical protein
MLVQVRGSLDRDAQALANDLSRLDGLRFCAGHDYAGAMGS